MSLNYELNVRFNTLKDANKEAERFNKTMKDTASSAENLGEEVEGIDFPSRYKRAAEAVAGVRDVMKNLDNVVKGLNKGSLNDFTMAPSKLKKEFASVVTEIARIKQAMDTLGSSTIRMSKEGIEDPDDMFNSRLNRIGKSTGRMGQLRTQLEEKVNRANDLADEMGGYNPDPGDKSGGSGGGGLLALGKKFLGPIGTMFTISKLIGKWNMAAGMGATFLGEQEKLAQWGGSAMDENGFPIRASHNVGPLQQAQLMVNVAKNTGAQGGNLAALKDLTLRAALATKSDLDAWSGYYGGVVSSTGNNKSSDMELLSQRIVGAITKSGYLAKTDEFLQSNSRLLARLSSSTGGFIPNSQLVAQNLIMTQEALGASMGGRYSDAGNLLDVADQSFRSGGKSRGAKMLTYLALGGANVHNLKGLRELEERQEMGVGSLDNQSRVIEMLRGLFPGDNELQDRMFKSWLGMPSWGASSAMQETFRGARGRAEERASESPYVIDAMGEKNKGFQYPREVAAKSEQSSVDWGIVAASFNSAMKDAIVTMGDFPEHINGFYGALENLSKKLHSLSGAPAPGVRPRTR